MSSEYGPNTIITADLLDSLQAFYMSENANEEEKELIGRLPAPLLDVVQCAEVPTIDIEWLLCHIDCISLVDAAARFIRWAVRRRRAHVGVSDKRIVLRAVATTIRDLRSGKPHVSLLYDYIRPDDRAAVSNTDISYVAIGLRMAAENALQGRAADAEMCVDRLFDEAQSLSNRTFDACMKEWRKKLIYSVKMRSKWELENKETESAQP